MIDNHTTMKKRRTDFGGRLPLHVAIGSQDKSNIYEILKQEDVQLSTVFNDGNRALHLLFKNFEENNVIEILRAFLRKDINLFHNNQPEETVFHIAVARRMMKTIDFLLQNGFDIENLYESNPVTHFFIENEHKRFVTLPKRVESEETQSINFVEWLISKGFDFDRQSRFRESALHLAIKRNLQHILPTLLKHSNVINHVDKFLKTTLLHSFIEVHSACKEKTIFNYTNVVCSYAFTRRYYTDIIQIMLDNGVSVDAVDTYGNTVLHTNVRANIETGIFEMVLEHFTNVHQKNLNGRTVLHAVTSMLSWPVPESMNETYLRIIESLVAKGSDVNSTDKYGSTPFYEIVRDGNLPAVTLMKEANADFSMTPYGNTMLHALAMKKRDKTSLDKSQEEIFELLIDADCDVNALDKVGQSPLHLAIKNRCSVVAKKLIENGADVNCRENTRGMTPLHYAAKEKVVELAKSLFQRGANVKGKDSRGARPVDLSADTESIQLLNMLLKRGAYAHTRDNAGKTALSRAVSKKRIVNIKELLKYGADINEACVLGLMESNYKENHNGAVDLVLQHWIKLEAANLPCLKEYRTFIKDADYQKFYQECLEEIELLKTTFIDDRTTLYLFLQVNPNRRCAYAYCEMLQKYVECPLFEKQFPKYSVLIQGNYHTAMARKSLVDKAKQVWQEMTEIILPDVCIELVLAFIDNADLVNTVGEY